MKSHEQAARDGSTSAIVHLASVDGEHGADPVQRARAFAEPLLAAQLLDTGEDALGHADGVAQLLRGIGAAPTLCAAAYLVYAGDYLQRPEEMVRKAFGDSYASLVTLTRKLVQIQRAARAAQVGPEHRAEQTERVRKMLLAFSRDLRVVLLRLASRLQTLRWYAAHKQPCPRCWRRVTADLRAAGQPAGHLAGQVGDRGPGVPLPAPGRLPAHGAPAGRNPQPSARQSVATARADLVALLAAAGLHADVQGRPKHLYSIWKKMQGKHLSSIVCSTPARCVWWCPTWPPAMPRWRACTKPGARWKASSTTTSRAPSPTATRALHTVVLGATAGRWKCRSARAPCTSTPSMAWPRTGCTRKPARGAMPASAQRRRGAHRRSAQGCAA
jgi:GTP pyrophosphokinase